MELGGFSVALAERRARLQFELEDEHRRKRLDQQLAMLPQPRSGGGGGGGYAGGRIGPAGHAPVGFARPTAARYAAIAKGSQPAVVKLASYGGGGRAGAMIAYVSREGGLRLENERGEKLDQSGAVAKVLSEWEQLMDNRAFSKDIASFSFQLDGDFSGLDEAELREIGRATLHGLLASRAEDGEDRHSFAFGIERQADGAAVMTGLMVLRSTEGQRRTPDAKGEAMIGRRIEQTKGTLPSEASQFRFTGFGNGVEYGTFKMRELVAKFDGQVSTDRGKAIADGKQAGDLVQRHWRGELHSRAPRDVMHLIMSAKAGTDAPAFEAAARGFLAAQFGEQGHRYVFALHDPANDPKPVEDGGRRPHVHAHAIITMKSDHGDRVRVSPATFRAWRESMAEQARGQGIHMEMTDRRDINSAPAYTRNQVRPVSRKGRTEHEGTSRPAHARYVAKREGARVHAHSVRSQQYGAEAARTWGALALSADTQIAGFARAQIEENREVEAGSAKVIPFVQRPEASAIFTENMVRLQALIAEDTSMADSEQREIQTRPEFELYEKSVNAAIFRAEREITDPDERATLDDFTQSVRDLVEARRTVVEMAAAITEHAQLREQGVDVDAAFKRYDDAIERHGEEAVSAGNPLLQNMNRAQEAWVDAGQPESVDHPAAAIYARELEAVVDAARAGNGFLAEIVEGNEALRDAAEQMDAAAREDETPNRQNASEADGSTAAPPAAAGGGDQEKTGPQYRADDREPSQDEIATRELHEQQLRLDATTKTVNKGRDEQASGGDRRGSDPASQQVPRQEQQRERDRDRERDDDDRDQ